MNSPLHSNRITGGVLSKSPAPADFLKHLSGLHPTSYSYHMPVVRIEMAYHKAKRKRTKNRILIDVRGTMRVVEDAAKLLLEKQGFTVLSGRSVTEFMSLFLISKSWGDNPSSPYDTYLDWVGLNGYSRGEAERLRTRQRALVRQYFKGDESHVGEMFRSALALAWKYYIPADCAGQKRMKKADSGGGEFVEFGFKSGGNPLKEERLFAEEQKVFLKAFVEEFSQSCLRKAEMRPFITACMHPLIRDGAPDLFVFNTEKRTWFFAEVKSASDSLRPHQYAWMERMHKSVGEHLVLVRIVPSKA